MPIQHGRPILVDDLHNPQRLMRLERLARTNTVAASPPAYREILIQKLVHADPSILPIEEIEPVFAGVRAICMELGLSRYGADKWIDNLLITPEGRICICECKLWNNRESVREVIGQMLDYAAELSDLPYTDLRDRVRKALRTDIEDPIVDAVLGEQADEDQKLDFINSVSRSLRLGNFLLLLVSDRIRPEMERITDLLERHSMLGFSLGLVEMAIYGAGEGGPFYLQPRVLTKTEIVTRTIFVQGEPEQRASRDLVAPPSAPTSLSEQEFYAGLTAIQSDLPGRTRAFLKRCEELGCTLVLKRTYCIYFEDAAGRRLNLGIINPNGMVEFWSTASRDADLGAPVGLRYLTTMATLVPSGTVTTESPNPLNWNIRSAGKVGIPLSLVLDRADGWLAAIEALANAIRTLEEAAQATDGTV